jgi:hypothetical protein
VLIVWNGIESAACCSVWSGHNTTDNLVYLVSRQTVESMPLLSALRTALFIVSAMFLLRNAAKHSDVLRHAFGAQATFLSGAQALSTRYCSCEPAR